MASTAASRAGRTSEGEIIMTAREEFVHICITMALSLALYGIVFLYRMAIIAR